MTIGKMRNYRFKCVKYVLIDLCGTANMYICSCKYEGINDCLCAKWLTRPYNAHCCHISKLAAMCCNSKKKKKTAIAKENRAISSTATTAERNAYSIT